MSVRRVIFAVVAAVGLLACAGCVSTSDTGGWVIIDKPETSKAPPPAKKKPPARDMGPPGKRRAAENHLRSAYRFLQKNKPDHALKELQKAGSSRYNDFWIYYYSGGAYYFKGMYGKANEQWDKAYRHAGEYNLKSRLRTCQSYVAYRLEDAEGAAGYLKRALDLDGRNRQARLLLEDLESHMDRPDTHRSWNRQEQEHPAYDEQPERSRYVNDKIGGSGGAGQGDANSSDDNLYSARYGKDEGKQVRSGEFDPSHGKKGPPPKNRKPKSRDKRRKGPILEDPGDFRTYFLIEMGAMR
jgi:tetratricopeptide (TPR) repeat protein